MNIFSTALAQANSEEQGKFFNDFSRVLIASCGSRAESQLCYIADALDSNSRKLVTDLAEFIRMNEESRPKYEKSLSEMRREKYEIEKQIAELREKLAETAMPDGSELP